MRDTSKPTKMESPNPSQQPHTGESADIAASQPVGNRGRKWLKLAIQSVIMLLVVVGIARAIRNGMNEIENQQIALAETAATLQEELASSHEPKEVDRIERELKVISSQRFSWWTVRWPRLGLASVVYFLGTIPAASFWLASLRRMGQNVSWRTTARAYYLSQLGKYFPGKALVVILRVGTLHRVGVPASVAGASVFMETLTLMAAGAVVASACFAFSLGLTHLLTLIAAGLAVFLGAVSSPAVFSTFLKRMRKGASDPTQESTSMQKPRGYTWGFWIRGIGFLCLGWLVTGFSLMLVVSALPLAGVGSSFSLAGWTIFTGTASLALVAGFLSLIPGGAGVRELVITQALAPLIGYAPALAAAVWMRLAWLLAELVAAGILYIMPQDDA